MIENQEGEEVLKKEIGPGENKIALTTKISTINGEKIEKNFLVGYSIEETKFYNPDGFIRIISNSLDFEIKKEKFEMPYQTKILNYKIVLNNIESLDIVIENWKLYKEDVDTLEIRVHEMMYPNW